MKGINGEELDGKAKTTFAPGSYAVGPSSTSVELALQKQPKEIKKKGGGHEGITLDEGDGASSLSMGKKKSSSKSILPDSESETLVDRSAATREPVKNILPYLDDSESGTLDNRAAATREPGAYPHRGPNQVDSSHFVDVSAPLEHHQVPADPFDGLAQAVPVPDPNAMEEAEPVEQNLLDKQEAKEKQKRLFNRRVCCRFAILATCLVVVILFVSLGLRNDNATNEERLATEATEEDTSAASRPLPPMQNLLLLYQTLPQVSQESLYNTSTPQRMAWNWLRNHPNLTNLEEWRKKQLYALATFFYSFAGPSWPEEHRSRWLNVNTSECSWIITEEEMAPLVALNDRTYGPGSYSPQDIRPCYENGEIQHLLASQLILPPEANPKVPPEISFLTGLKIMGTWFSQLRADLADILVSELAQLPNLQSFSVQSGGVSGSIPKEIIGQMTNLRHLMLGDNNLNGKVPDEISLMTSLEYLGLARLNNLKSTMPSVIGLMTSLTYLSFFRSSMFGTLPTQLGLLTNNEWLAIVSNQFTGTLPSQLGLCTKLTNVGLLGENLLTGSLPTQLGLLTNAEFFDIKNNAFSGSLPSELALLTGLKELTLGNNLKLSQSKSSNSFSGTFPPGFWQLSHLESLSLQGLPLLHATIPSHVFMPNLTEFYLAGTPLVGNLPENVCSVEDLEFDCTGTLCGCDCPCNGSHFSP